jgi:hypothetical protein
MQTAQSGGFFYVGKRLIGLSKILKEKARLR